MEAVAAAGVQPGQTIERERGVGVREGRRRRGRGLLRHSTLFLSSPPPGQGPPPLEFPSLDTQLGGPGAAVGGKPRQANERCRHSPSQRGGPISGADTRAHYVEFEVGGA